MLQPFRYFLLIEYVVSNLFYGSVIRFYLIHDRVYDFITLKLYVHLSTSFSRICMYVKYFPKLILLVS